MVQDDPERKIEAWLDEALAQYSAAEPRAGLETRVLRSLRAEKRGLPRHGWKAWALATAAAVIVVLVVVVRNRDASPVRTAPPEIATAPAPAAAPAEPAPGARQPDATTDRGSHAKTRESSPPESTGVEQAPGRETPVSAITIAGESGSARVGNRGHGGARAASGPALNPRVGDVFPVPAPLSEQERLAMAAVRSGILSAALPQIPPGDELLPQVVIQEIRIGPLLAIEPI